MRRNTEHLNIPYYVKDKFENDYQGSVARLENSVEEDYIATMKQACFRERSYRKFFLLFLIFNFSKKKYLNIFLFF